MPGTRLRKPAFEKNSGETEAAKRTAQDNAVEDGLLHEGKRKDKSCRSGV